MTTTTFSELPVATSLTGAEILAVTQDGESRQVSVEELRQGIAVSSVEGRRCRA